jgi:hypothetical protein
MPRKIRELIRDLERAGFVNRGGRGDHRKRALAYGSVGDLSPDEETLSRL